MLEHDDQFDDEVDILDEALSETEDDDSGFDDDEDEDEPSYYEEAEPYSYLDDED